MPKLTEIRKDPAVGFTLAHLLTIMIMKQHQAHDHRTDTDWPRFEWFHIVEVRRRLGTDGVVIWFPVIELRIRPHHWKAPEVL